MWFCSAGEHSEITLVPRTSDFFAKKVVAMGFLLSGHSCYGIPMNRIRFYGILVEWDLLLWNSC